MRKRTLKRLSKRQRGFTLVDLMVAVAILGTISSALTGVIFSIFTTTGGRTRITETREYDVTLRADS